MIEVHSSVVRPRVSEAVFFGFDDIAIPIRSGVAHRLISGKVGHYSQPLAIENGPPGAHDEMIFYYGSALEINGQYHLWYLGQKGDARSPFFEEQFTFGRNPRPAKKQPNQQPRHGDGDRDTGKLCYAVSDDGIRWRKPDLGLVEWNGSTHNNLCDFPIDHGLLALAVVHEPDETNAQRRYKMTYEDGEHGHRMCVAFSADGLRWQRFDGNPVATVYEPSGLIQYHGCYYTAGQVGYRCADFPGRYWSTLFSYDFETWNHGGIHALKRPGGTVYPDLGHGPVAQEQVHLGAALHHRGNVILGIYGQWHHPPTNDRRQVACDLGLAISADAIHYHEPQPGFRLIGAEEERQTPHGLGPALSQGQGMIQVGDETRYFYGAWPAGGHIRTAVWQRDRFGFLAPIEAANGAKCLTCPFLIDSDNAHVTVNVDGLGEHTQMFVELLDAQCRPIDGYAGENARAAIVDNGFATTVRWPACDRLPRGGPFRLSVSWRGVRPEDARLYAVYIGQ